MLSSADEIHAIEAGQSEADACDNVQLPGDWQGYLARSQSIGVRSDATSRSALRRQYALVFLGRRAQFAGGVYNSRSPTVFTALAVEQLSVENRQRRQSSYPWLANLLAVMETLEREQNTKENLGAAVIRFPVRGKP